MGSPFRRYGFAAIVVGGLALLGVAIVGKSIGSGSQNAAAPAQAGPSAGGRPGGGPPGGGMATPVRVATAEQRTFSDGIEALGTAQAWESVVISTTVTDTIRALRFDSGDRVRAGQVLVELAAAEESADLAASRAARSEAERELERFQELYERGFAPRARLEEAQASFDAAEARVQAGAARIGDRVIRAPFAGVMGLRNVSPGALVRPGDVIATLDDTSRIKLDFDVAEVRMGQLREGVPIEARTAAYPDTVFSGSIDQVDSRVNAQTRTVRVRAVLANEDGRLRPGMLLTVQIQSNPREALGVPEEALVDRADGSFVFQVAQGERGPAAMLVPVRVGQRVGGMAEILEGLAPGDAVVVEGVNRVRPGQPVTLGGVGEGGPPAPAAAAAPASRT